jgi:hypothetical protein
MVIDVCVNGHPARVEDWERIREQLSFQYENVQESPFLPFREVLDYWGEGIYPTHLKALRETRTEATHALFLQEDILLCENFLPAVQRTVEVYPDDIISYYCPRKICTVEHQNGRSWVAIRGGIWGQAMLYPVRHIPAILDWCASTLTDNYPHDDTAITAYCLDKGIRAMITIPSLVEHVGYDRSLLGHSAQIGKNVRRAALYIGDTDPLSIDWERRAITEQKSSLREYLPSLRPYLKRSLY